MRRVLIAGCGDVGTALGLALGETGHAVWGLRRDPDDLPRPIQPLEADLTRPRTLESLPDRLDAVVFSAAAPERTESAYRSTYVDGLRNLADALRIAGQTPDRFLFTSSTGIYHQDDGSWVNESSPIRPTGFTGQTMREAEQLLEGLPWRSVAVRFGGIYGPGRTRLVERARQSTGADGSGDRFTNRIHVDDCAGVLAHLLALESPAPVYVAVDDAPARLTEVIAFLRRRLGLPATDPDASEPRGKRCDNQRLRASGYAFRHPSYREGYAAMLADAGPDGQR